VKVVDFDVCQNAPKLTMAQLELPDSIYSWTVDFLESHAHCTKYAGQVSAVAVVQASIIQGSAIRPASYVITAADLHPVIIATSLGLPQNFMSVL